MRAPRPYTVSKFLGEYLVVDQTGELENVGAGDRKSGEVHGGHGALPSLGLAGSATGGSEPTRGGVRVSERPPRDDA